MPRLMHTSNLEVGYSSLRFTQPGSVELSEARFETVAKIAELATSENCDAVLVAGDTFASQNASDDDLQRLFACMAGFSGPWVVLPGNRDNALPGGIWHRVKNLKIVPENVVIALKSRVIELHDAGIAVLAAPIFHYYGPGGDRTGIFERLESSPGLLRVGLAYGGVEGVEKTDLEFPRLIAADRAQRADLDYLALGGRRGVKRIDAKTWYSGTPEGKRYLGNNDAGYALIVDIAERGAEAVVVQHRTCEYEWRNVDAVLISDFEVDELLTRLATLPTPAVVTVRLGSAVTEAKENALWSTLIGMKWCWGRLRRLD